MSWSSGRSKRSTGVTGAPVCVTGASRGVPVVSGTGAFPSDDNSNGRCCSHGARALLTPNPVLSLFRALRSRTLDDQPFPERAVARRSEEKKSARQHGARSGRRSPARSHVRGGRQLGRPCGPHAARERSGARGGCGPRGPAAAGGAAARRVQAEERQACDRCAGRRCAGGGRAGGGRRRRAGLRQRVRRRRVAPAAPLPEQGGRRSRLAGARRTASGRGAGVRQLLATDALPAAALLPAARAAARLPPLTHALLLRRPLPRRVDGMARPALRPAGETLTLTLNLNPDPNPNPNPNQARPALQPAGEHALLRGAGRRQLRCARAA
eukprot:scaffold36691_cov63-Phaeocystis_antarctica.AAC.1